MSGEFREIVRILNTDLIGSNIVSQEIRKIKGIGPTLSMAILVEAGIPINKRVGELSDEELAKIEEMVKNVGKYFPDYMLNRRRDRFTGESTHLIGSDLSFAMQRDIDFEKSINSWRGVRHKLGLKVRGQRTKTTGRKTKKPVGVKRKKR
jgi:small subunit ribosomal protein S13